MVFTNAGTSGRVFFATAYGEIFSQFFCSLDLFWFFFASRQKRTVIKQFHYEVREATPRLLSVVRTTMDKLSKYEHEYGMKFPKVYRDFYYLCESSTPINLIGTDLVNKNSDLKKWADELLLEHEISNFFESDDFVFMMHQGYMFWYFKADGNEDPEVFGFSEVELEPRNHGSLKTFLQGILR